MAVAPLLTTPTLTSGAWLLTSDGSAPGAYPIQLTGTGVTTTATRVTSQGYDVVLGVEVAFDSDNTRSVYVNDGTRLSLMPPTWYSITEYVRNVQIQRGRQAELDQFQAGSVTITLDDRAGTFHPANPTPVLPSRGWPSYTDQQIVPAATIFPSAPTYPNQPIPIPSYPTISLLGTITPMRRVRVYADWMGTRYPIFQGYAESWTPAYAAAGLDETVTLRAVDAFKALRYSQVGAPGAGQVTMTSQYPGNRILSLLSYVSGVASRITNVGSEVLRQITYSGQDLISAIQDAAQGGLGLVYCDTDGAVRYDDRTYRLLNENTTRAVFGEEQTSGEIPYQDIVLAYDDTLLYTEVTVTPTGSGGTDQPQTAQDADAQKKYGRRVYALDVPLQKAIGGVAPATDADTTLASTFASYLLSRYKQSGLRVQSLTVEPQAYPQTAWPAVLGVPLGGLIRVKRRNVWDVSNPTDKFVFVENVTHDISPGRWTTKFELSPSDVQAYWIIGRPGFSEVGSSTRLSY